MTQVTLQQQFNDPFWFELREFLERCPATWDPALIKEANLAWAMGDAESLVRVARVAIKSGACKGWREKLREAIARIKEYHRGR